MPFSQANAFSVVMDYNNASTGDTIKLTKNDVKGDILHMTIKKSGVAVDLTDTTVKVNIRKPDNTYVSGTATLVTAASGTADYEFGTEERSVVGPCVFTVSVCGATSERKTTTQYKFTVVDDLVATT